MRSKPILDFTDEKTDPERDQNWSKIPQLANGGNRLCFLLWWPLVPFPFLPEATNWLGNWFPRSTGRISKISVLSKLVTLSPEGLSPEGRSTGVTAPVGSGQPGPLRGWWVGRELLWGLLQWIVCSSVFVCLSFRSEPQRGEVRLLVEREKGLFLSVRGGEEGRGRGRRLCGGQNAAPSNSSSPLQLLSFPREFQALLILGPGQLP